MIYVIKKRKKKFIYLLIYLFVFIIINSVPLSRLNISLFCKNKEFLFQFIASFNNFIMWLPHLYKQHNNFFPHNTNSLVFLKDVVQFEMGQVSEKGWIKMNVGQKGFYRVQYEEENWNALSAQLVADHLVCLVN